MRLFRPQFEILTGCIIINLRCIMLYMLVVKDINDLVIYLPIIKFYWNYKS